MIYGAEEMVSTTDYDEVCAGIRLDTISTSSLTIYGNFLMVMVVFMAFFVSG